MLEVAADKSSEADRRTKCSGKKVSSSSTACAALTSCSSKHHFADIALYTDLSRFLDKLAAIVHGEDQDRHAWAEFANHARGVKTVEHRHAHVEDEKVWLKLTSLFDGFLSIGCFAADAIAGARFEKQAHTLANQVLIVSYEDSHCASHDSSRNCRAKGGVDHFQYAYST